MMEETAALPAYLTDPSVLYVEANDWGDMLYMVQKRLDGKRSGWFVVTIAGDQSFWDGPYTLRKALKRFDQQLDCLQAVLGHVGALQPAWESNWQHISRYVIGAPAIVAESAEFQTLKAELDRAFENGDKWAFIRASVPLEQLCQQIVVRDGIASWW